jgi:cytochrome c2
MGRRILTLIATAAAGLAIVALAGCQQKIPEEDTYAGQLYVRRCGNCHQPYNPQSLTPAMWEIQVPKMEQKIAQAGLPPLAPEQKQTILDYLQRNAGHQ